MFSVCPHLGGGGYPSQVQPGGGYMSQVQPGGYPDQGGYPNGGYPGRTTPDGGTPMGVPHLCTPVRPGGVPRPGGYPTSGTPIRPGQADPGRGYLRWGVPRLRYPPSDLAGGVPHLGYPPVRPGLGGYRGGGVPL